MRVYNSLALCTLIVNWTLTLLAFIAVVVVYCHRLAARGLYILVRPDDILLLASFIVGIALVSVSTWAILDEGQAEHQENVSGSQLERAAKVSYSPPRPPAQSGQFHTSATIGLTGVRCHLISVLARGRGPVDPGYRITPHRRLFAGPQQLLTVPLRPSHYRHNHGSKRRTRYCICGTDIPHLQALRCPVGPARPGHLRRPSSVFHGS